MAAVSPWVSESTATGSPCKRKRVRFRALAAQGDRDPRDDDPDQGRADAGSEPRDEVLFERPAISDREEEDDPEEVRKRPYRACPTSPIRKNGATMTRAATVERRKVPRRIVAASRGETFSRSTEPARNPESLS